MKYTKMIMAVVMLLLMLAGCNEQTPGNHAAHDAAVPNLIVEKEVLPEQDTEGFFQTVDFSGERSNAVVLGGFRTEKIQELEAAEIQRETVPDGSIEWIPGVW